MKYAVFVNPSKSPIDKDSMDLVVFLPMQKVGKGAILNNLETEFGFGSTEFHVLRAKHNIDNLFLYYVTKSAIFMKIGEAFMSGAAGKKRVPTDFISDFPLVVPTKPDQTAKTKKIIALQKEYRTALISEVVTGKIKVTAEEYYE